MTKEELISLQQIEIANGQFIDMGFRKKGGFVSEHDHTTGYPLFYYISAQWQDVEQLIDGLARTYELLNNSNFDAGLAATSIAFGFVFIHPFEDGNGRIHRYLIHHVLAKNNFHNKESYFLFRHPFSNILMITERFLYRIHYQSYILLIGKKPKTTTLTS